MKLIKGDCLDELKKLDSNSIDSIVCDPPYGISYQGKNWDKDLPTNEIWEECFRVLKPGGYILAFSSTRTFHHLANSIENSGFMTHPMLVWLFSTGFPKGTDLSKQFDKAAGVEREKGKLLRFGTNLSNGGYGSLENKERVPIYETQPSTELAKKWDGWKYGLQTLKPAMEPIYMGQKPWKNKEVKKMTEQILKWGVGALNIRDCLVKGEDRNRVPANIIHDGSSEVEKEFKRFTTTPYNNSAIGRFFYVPKPSQKEKKLGLVEGDKNIHPTVKPIDLIAHLIKLVTPNGGTTIDPFLGSGTAALAVLKINEESPQKNLNFIGIEREKDFYDMASSRVENLQKTDEAA